MSSTLLNQTNDAPVGTLAKPLSVEGVDDNDIEGHVPRDILQNGTRIVIPYWIEPVANDELWVMLLQDGVEHRLYTVFYPVPLTVDFLYFDLTPQHLANDGIAYIYYKIWKGSGGTEDDSKERKLTIDHTPLLTLDEPTFPNATYWGYLNNQTVPPLTSGATVAIPPLTNVALPGDVAKIYWQGYSSLNGSGAPVAGTYGVWERELFEQDINNGFEIVVPFQPNISPLIDNDSATVTYQLFRGGGLFAESKKGLVKIDRVTPGESSPSSLNTIGEKNMAITYVPAKQRPVSTHSGTLTTAITVDVLADGSIPVAVLADVIIVKVARAAPTEEHDDDEIDIFYARESEPLGKARNTAILGPIQDRPANFLSIELERVTGEEYFPEDSQPNTPTPWQVQLDYFKGGGGTNDPSNIVVFNIDRTAPFEVKYPSRKKNPPTPAPVFTNMPTDSDRTVNEAWLTANAELEFQVDVSYALRRLDDELEVYLSGNTPNDPGLQVFKGTVDATGTFTVPSTVLRSLNLPNGRVNIHYFWTDIAGNRSASSASTALFTLALALKPVLKAPPLIPVTDPNGSTTVYLDDIIANSVFGIVERAPIENAEPGDEIEFYLEEANNQLNYVTLGTQPLLDVNLTFPFPYDSELKTLFGTLTEALEIRAWFEIKRGTDVPISSPEKLFWLDLYPPGGTYPELPDLTNPSFALPVVTGASKTTNVLLPDDRDKAGEFKVTLNFTDPPLTPAETAKCYVNNTMVGSYSPFVDVTEFAVEIKVDVISSLPTPSVEAYWTRQKTGVDKNVIKSSPETVTVNGKSIDLPPPTIRIRNPTTKDQMDCYAMDGATANNWRLAVTIPKDATLLPQGTVVTVYFAAYSDAGGTNLIPGTEDSQPYTIQDAATEDVAHVANETVFKTAQPILGSRAFAKYWYTADIGGVQSSIPIIKPLDTISSSGEWCDRMPVPAS